MISSYKHLVDNLNSFRKKYLLIRLIEGFLLLVSVVMLGLLGLLIAESISYFSTAARTFLVGALFLISVALVIWLFIIPLLKWLSILKSKSNRQLADIISKEHEAIKDKLINVLELAENADDNPLVKASVEQKSKALIQYDFSAGIKYRVLKRNSFILGGSLVFVLIGFLFFANSFNSAGERLVHFRTFYEKPAPFTFQLLNDNLAVKRGDNLQLRVQCEGREVPELLYVNISGSNYLMNQQDGFYEYELEHVNNSFPIYFTNQVFHSKKYEVKVLPSPMIQDFVVDVDAPAYTGVPSETYSNVGDLKVPAGSNISWKFTTIDTDSVKFTVAGDVYNLEKNEFERRFFKTQPYFISIDNQYFKYDSLLQFKVDVIPDEFPKIEVVQLRDSLNYSRFYFKGSIQDDYGFHKLSFNLVVNQRDTIFDIPIVKNLDEQDFYYTYDFKLLSDNVKKVNYYFQVADNDYFNNYKITSSDAYEFVFPNDEELTDFENEQFAEIDQLMEKSHQLSQDIRQSIDELRFKSLGDNATKWEKQQMANEIVNKKNQLESVLNEIKEKNSELNNMMNSFSEEKKEVLEKQQEIEQLLDEVMSDELKELFEEFNKLAQDFNSDQFNQLDEKYDMALEDLSEQLERNLQVLKRMKVEQKLERVVDKLYEISKKEKVNLQEFNELRDYNKLKNAENRHSESLENLMNETKLANDLNNELLKPMNLPSFEKEFNEITENYKNIQEQIENKRRRKIADDIENNSQQLDDLAFSIQQVLDQNRSQQQFENLANLRQLLDNLVYLSLEQERIFNMLRKAGVENPVVNEVNRLQDELYNQSEMVKDSLYALAKRTPAINNIVNKEVIDMQYSMKQTLDELNEDRINYAAKHQQLSITAINNLAVFLNEALDNLEEQMANSMPGDQQSDKQGKGSKSGMNMLKQAQESMKEQLQQMIDQMKSGNAGNSSKQLGQTLAQQEMMQSMIRDLLNSSEVGSSSKEQLKHIDQLLEQNKVDLMNGNLTQQIVQRQNLILDRLLKAEHVEMEREVDDERKSTTADEQFFSNPAGFFEYNKKESNFGDQIDRGNYKLKKFYLQKYKTYIKQIKQED